MDLIYLGAVLVFVRLTWLLVAGCGLLGDKQWISPTWSAPPPPAHCWPTCWSPCSKRRTC